MAMVESQRKNQRKRIGIKCVSVGEKEKKRRNDEEKEKEKMEKWLNLKKVERFSMTCFVVMKNG